MPWRVEFEEAGNVGGHTDSVKGPFVQEYIAPLIMQAGAQAAQPVAAGRTPNPDYGRWARFTEGAWAAFEGHQLFDGARRPVRMVARLVARHPDKVVIERTYRLLDAEQEPLRVQTFVAAATIAAADHPLTLSTARIITLPPASLEVGGQTLPCEVLSVETAGRFPEWGSDIACRLYVNRAVPGGLVKVSLKSHRDGEPFEFDGQLVEYGSPPGRPSR